MNIKLKERVLLLGLLPKEMDIATLVLKKDVTDKLNLSQEEVVSSGFRAENGSLVWENNIEKDIEFTNAELSFVKKAIKDASESKKIIDEHYDLIKLFDLM